MENGEYCLLKDFEIIVPEATQAILKSKTKTDSQSIHMVIVKSFSRESFYQILAI